MTLSKGQEHAAIILLSAGAGSISLAGGAALIVHGLVDRPTQDLDAFSRPDGNVLEIAASVTSAFIAAGYLVEDISEANELRTFMASRQGRGTFGRPSRPVKVQIGRDFQLLDSVPSPVGQTLDPLELAANKVLTVYDRPRARDADDIARLVPRFGLRKMLDVADRKQVEPGRTPGPSRASQRLSYVAADQGRRVPVPRERGRRKTFHGRHCSVARIRLLGFGAWPVPLTDRPAAEGQAQR